MLQWRNSDLDFSSIEALVASLDARRPIQASPARPIAEDQMVLEVAARDEKVRAQRQDAGRYRATLGRLPNSRLSQDLAGGACRTGALRLRLRRARAARFPTIGSPGISPRVDRIDGDIDTLSARLAQVRTWTFIANRSGWLDDPEHWQSVARQVEDSLSDALHERLTQRFVDRRTSVLMRRLRENAMLEAEITPPATSWSKVSMSDSLQGFRFTRRSAARRAKRRRR